MHGYSKGEGASYFQGLDPVFIEVCLDFLSSGSGKTRIALNLIMSKLPQMKAQGQVAVMLCPTVPLVLQVRKLVQTLTSMAEMDTLGED